MSYEKEALKQYRNEVGAIKKMIEEGEWNYAKKKCSELIKKMDRILPNEICCQCGESVVQGSGHFVNRLVQLDTVEERKNHGIPFPEGDFTCAECDVRRFGKETQI